VLFLNENYFIKILLLVLKVGLTSFRISEDFSVLFVDSDQPDRIDERQEDGGEADRTLEKIQLTKSELCFSSKSKSVIMSGQMKGPTLNFLAASMLTVAFY
jgi:hypothetical protein